jgi:hypothetical protein
VPGFFTSGIGPIVCIQSITWSNPPARLVAETVRDAGPVDAWLMLRVSHAVPRGPWPAILDPAALVRAPWTGRAGGLVARYLVRA